MGIFDGIQEATKVETHKDQFPKDVFIAEGEHLLETLVCKKFISQKDGLTRFVYQGKVLKSSCHNVGETVVRIIKLDPAKSPEWKPKTLRKSLNEIANILSACTNTDISEVSPSDADMATAPENPLAGMKVLVKAKASQFFSPKTGKASIYYVWQSV